MKTQKLNQINISPLKRCYSNPSINWILSMSLVYRSRIHTLCLIMWHTYHVIPKMTTFAVGSNLYLNIRDAHNLSKINEINWQVSSKLQTGEMSFASSIILTGCEGLVNISLSASEKVVIPWFGPWCSTWPTEMYKFIISKVEWWNNHLKLLF